MIETLRFWTIVVLLGFGVLFTLVSAVGVLRLPDVYSRAHTASQTDTLGAGMALAAVALALGWQHATVYTVLLLFFVFVTNPTAAHAIARSAAETGVEPWTVDDSGAGAVPASEPGTDPDSDADPESGGDVAADGGSDGGAGRESVGGSDAGTGPENAGESTAEDTDGSTGENTGENGGDGR